jgi:hypothetical protein
VARVRGAARRIVQMVHWPIVRLSVYAQVLFDDLRVFDTGNDLHRAATVFTGFSIDLEYPLEALNQVLNPEEAGCADLV